MTKTPVKVAVRTTPGRTAEQAMYNLWKLIVLSFSLMLCSASTIQVQNWRSIAPLRSTRSDVRRLLGKPLFEQGGPVDVYDVEEGRLNVLYVLQRCEQGLPADWGNWNVPPDTVVSITVHLQKEIALSDLKVPHIEKYRSHTDDSGATYYILKERGIEYQVENEMVTSITYGPTEKDKALLCRRKRAH